MSNSSCLSSHEKLKKYHSPRELIKYPFVQFKLFFFFVLDDYFIYDFRKKAIEQIIDEQICIKKN